MAQFIIPVLQNTAAWRQRATLDGVDFILDFAWNGRESAWYLGISDADGNSLLVGRKLVSNRPLLRGYRYIEGLPKGELVAIDKTGTISYAGYDTDNLGIAVKLYYLDAAELATL